MKAQIIAVLTLSALALTPAIGAPKKMSAPAKSKASSAQSASPAQENKLSAAQIGAKQLVAELTTTQKSKMLTLLNKGTAEDLTVIKGISKTRSAAIEKARPFESIDEVLKVRGIGRATMSEIVSHARSLTTSTRKSASSSSKKKS